MMRSIPILAAALIAALSFSFADFAFAQTRNFSGNSRNESLANQGFRASAESNNPASAYPSASTTASQRTEKLVPVHTRQTQFGIPYQINENPQNVSEVLLYVSADRGNRWQLYSRQYPGNREFRFAANGDGEFWFAIKTVDMNKVPRPAGKPTPEIIVVVDSKNPALSFNVHTDPSGKLVAWWRATDPNIDTESIEILYRPHSPFRVNLARWKKAEFEPPTPRGNGTYEAKSEWWPVTESLTLDIQARIADKAGNVSTVDRRVLLSKIVASPPQTSVKPPAIDRFAVRQQNVGQVRAQQDYLARQTQIQQRPARQTQIQQPAAQQLAQQQIGQWQTNQPSSSGWQSAKSRQQELVANNGAEALNQKIQAKPVGQVRSKAPPNIANTESSFSTSSEKSLRQEIRFEGASKPNRLGPAIAKTTEGGFFRQDWNVPAIDQPTGETTTTTTSIAKRSDYYDTSKQDPERKIENLADQRSEKVKSQLIKHRTITSPAETNNLEQTLGEYANHQLGHQTERKRLSKSRRFNIDYEIDSVDPQSVTKVSVWITRDSGKSWSIWGTDEDLKSPVTLEVEKDGVYGIQIGVASDSGLSAPAPRGADDADMWIEVDTTDPFVEITSTPYGSGIDAGKLVINWEVDDRHLLTAPVSLFYATHPDGPWKEIATGLENVGNYRWKVSRSMPRRVYLRLEAIDVAGNKGTYILDKSIDLAGLVPRGRIRSVTPIEKP